jgi:hypothetical protein
MHPAQNGTRATGRPAGRNKVNGDGKLFDLESESVTRQEICLEDAQNVPQLWRADTLVKMPVTWKTNTPETHYFIHKMYIYTHQ